MRKHRPSNNVLRAKAGLPVASALVFSALILIALLIAAYFIVIPEKVQGLGMLLFRGELKHIASPRTGMIETWFKEEGDTIHKGEKLATVIDHTTDDTIDIIAQDDGVLAEIVAFGNVFVDKGQTLAIISHNGDPRSDLELTAFVSSFEGKKIQPGMLALINPTITEVYRHGYMRARVKRVGKLPVSKASILSILKIPEVADFIRGQIKTEPFVVVLEPIVDETTQSGYAWTGPGPEQPLDSGVFAEATIIIREERLLSMLIPMRECMRTVLP